MWLYVPPEYRGESSACAAEPADSTSPSESVWETLSRSASWRGKPMQRQAAWQQGDRTTAAVARRGACGGWGGTGGDGAG